MNEEINKQIDRAIPIDQGLLASWVDYHKTPVMLAQRALQILEALEEKAYDWKPRNSNEPEYDSPEGN